MSPAPDPAPGPDAAARDPEAAARGYAAVLLTGGTGRRLGGADKASVELGGRPLLAWALDAVADATDVVVVGPPAPTPPGREVTFVREEPPLSGPAAGLTAGVEHLVAAGVVPPAGRVAVLAVDMPRVTPRTFARLLAAGHARDGAFLQDPAGYRQLCGVVRADRLLAAAPPAADRPGLSVRRLLAPLDLADVPAQETEAHDVDTWADLERLEGSCEGTAQGSD